MKRLFTYCFIMAASALLGSCMRDELGSGLEEYGSITLTASLEQPSGTRTVVQEDNSVFWDASEDIKVFCGGKSAKFSSTNLSPAASASFVGVGINPGAGDEIWALYPYDEDATFSDGVITTTVPSEQVACAGTFARNTNVTIARSTDRNLQFYNVCGGVRFSVREEGVSKVKFEGLDGEYVSGTVKVGFESGVPAVKEVTDGSRVITLTAPGGGTFETGKWYFISSLPGTLEKGYKIRIYKGDTYAKCICEQTVTVKRGIFGTVAEVDKGVEYEQAVLNLPATEQEMKESYEMTVSTGKEVNSIISDCLDTEGAAGDGLLRKIEEVENVVEAVFNESRTTVSVMQRDSIWVNYFLDAETSSSGISSKTSSALSEQVYVNRNRLSKHIATTTNGKPVSSKKALILVPFFTGSHRIVSDIDRYISALVNAGIPADNIDCFIDHQVALKHFRGDFLDDYDVIIIRTHGGTGYNAYNPEGESETLKKNVTSLSTSIPYSDELAVSLLNSGTLDDVAIAYLGRNETTKELEDPVLCITPSFLEGASFDDACVVLGACHSAEILNDDTYGEGTSMVQAFQGRGAGFVAGFKGSVLTNLANQTTGRFLELASNGISAQDAALDCINSVDLDLYCSSYRVYYSQWCSLTGQQKKDLSSQNPNLLTFSPETGSYYLADKRPELEEPAVGDDGITLSWKCDLHDFSVKTPKYVGIKEYDKDGWSGDMDTTITDFKIHYDVYYGGKRCDDRRLNTDPDNSLVQKIPMLPAGEYNWYVHTFIMKGDTVVDSFKSEVGKFTVTAPSTSHDFVDLGLSVKWATCNVGASKPEEYGDYFAWGETETKSTYDWSTYKWCNGSEKTLTKYNTDSYYGVVDNKVFLDGTDDVAYVKWGDGWRMPKASEWKELYEECTWEWTTVSGVKGYLVTSKKEGYTDKSIFLPTAGYFNGDYLIGCPSNGYYWSSILSDSEGAKILLFNIGGVGHSQFSLRSCGLPVRPVYVSDYVDAKEITLSQTELSLEVDEMVRLTASASPDNATDKIMRWISDDDNIASVSDAGLVIGNSVGTCSVSVSLWNGIRATCLVTVKAATNTHRYVDLGLSVKWATCNVGASKPEEYGDYFAWGETETKSTYVYSTYKWYGEKGRILKYNETDGKAVLDSEDDAAHVKWGENWRMPTVDEFTELIENCTWEETSKNGVGGIRATSKKSGYTDVSIFFPAAGQFGTKLSSGGVAGNYWTSSLCVTTTNTATAMHHYSRYSITKNYNRYFGYSVRPVME